MMLQIQLMDNQLKEQFKSYLQNKKNLYKHDKTSYDIECLYKIWQDLARFGKILQSSKNPYTLYQRYRLR